MFERELNYEQVFETLVTETSQYLIKNNLKAIVLGISGGIDSTVVAAICHEVSKRIGIPLIGRSLPIKNKVDELDTSILVGKAFCDDFKKVERLDAIFEDISNFIENEESGGQTLIADGNIQARLRMIYLYNLASTHNGLVMSTDNQSEYQLGFWTIHGDVGDFDPIQDLWKTEVYKLADYIIKRITKEGAHLAKSTDDIVGIKIALDQKVDQIKAIKTSMELTPTDGLGISHSDLDQIGAKSYEDVDRILRAALNPFNPEAMLIPLRKELGEEVVNKVLDRHKKSSFKRVKAPIYISRVKYEQNFTE